MRMYVMTVAAGLLLISVGRADDKDVIKRDKQELQGVWVPVKVEMGGQVMDKEEIKKQFKLGIDGDKLVTPGAEAKDAIYSGPLNLQVDGKLRRITIVGSSPGPGGEELKQHGIYKIDGDKLTLCLNVDCTSDTKPNEFESKPGSDFSIIEFRREKK
jgi:uncharacterized protein (TIGR03067 family)